MLALIGGSAFTQLDGWSVASSSAPETPHGATSAAISLGRFHDLPALFLPRHGVTNPLAPHCVNYRANLWALKQLGARTVVAINAVGGIASFAAPGVILLPDQIIDYTWGREHSYHDGVSLPLRHQEFSSPFDDTLRNLLLDAARRAGVAVVARGVYGCTQGPRLETSAEIERLARDGCDIVGMTAMPEAVLAAELELAYAGIAMVVNWAAGRSAGTIAMEEITRHAAACRQPLNRILEQTALLLGNR